MEPAPNIEFVPSMTAFRELGISKVKGYSLIANGTLPELLRDPATRRTYFLRHELKDAINKTLDGTTSKKQAGNPDDASSREKLVDRPTEINQISKKLTGSPLLPFDTIAAERLPIPKGECGIYFLFKGASVIYIGQSQYVYHRVRSHLATKDFEEFAFVPCVPNNLNIMESLYIHMFRPSFNGKYNGSSEMVAPYTLTELSAMLSRRN